MFYHCVHFWLKDDLTDEQRSAFLGGLQSLADSQATESVRVGVPAQTPREIVDNSYDYQLLVVFKDKAAHDIYQDSDPLHKAFVDGFLGTWTKIMIFDSLEA